MGAAEGRSMFSLESRCVALARAMGAQGVQNGGIDGASVVGCRPGRHARAARREPPRHAPRPRVVLGQRRAGHRVGHAPHGAHRAALPRRLGLHLLRLRLDPALRQHVRPLQLQRRGPRRLPRAAARLGRGRRAAPGDRGAAARGARAGGEARAWPCTASWGWRDVSAGRRADARDRTRSSTPRAPRTSRRQTRRRSWRRPDAIMERQLGILDVVRALWATGYEEEAGRVLAMGRARVAGDYLQTAAIFDEQMNVPLQGHRPQRLPGPGHRLRGLARRAARRSPPSASSARAPTCWRGTPPARGAAAAGRAPASIASRATARARAPTRARSASASPRRSRPSSGSRCPGCRSARRCAQIVAGIEEEGCVGAHRARAARRSTSA